MRFFSLMILLMSLCAVEVFAQEPLVWEATTTHSHVSRVIWNAEGSQIATASFDYEDDTHLQSMVEVWDAATGERLKSFGTIDDQPVSVVFNAEGTLLFTGLTSGEVAAWNLQDGQIVQRIPAHETAPNLTLSADGKWLVSWESSGVIIWDATALAPQIILTPESPDAALPIFALISPDSSTLALVDTAGVVTFYDLDTGEQVSKLLTDQTIEPYTAAYAPNGLSVALGYQSLVFWDVILRAQTSSLVIGSDVYRAVYRNDTQMAVADASGAVALWDVSSGGRGQTFAEGLDSVGDLAFSPDGSHLALGGADGQITVYAVME
jgi:WD40 repeat protein